MARPTGADELESAEEDDVFVGIVEVKVALDVDDSLDVALDDAVASSTPLS